MERVDNYRIQGEQAKARFLTYDQEKLIKKFDLAHDESYLYIRFLGAVYRICRRTGDMERKAGGTWVDGNSHGEIMTILDLLCDSREDRRLTGRLQSFQSFGRLFYSTGKEEKPDPWAEWIQENLEEVKRTCQEMGAEAIPGGDMGYAFNLFQGLQVAFRFWEGDEDFSPRLCWFWEENARMYLRFETMHFAVNLVLDRIKKQIKPG